MDRILRPNQVAEFVGLGERRLRQLEAQGKFPRRFKIHPGSNASGYLESEVDAWIQASAAAGRTEPAQA